MNLRAGSVLGVMMFGLSTAGAQTPPPAKLQITFEEGAVVASGLPAGNQVVWFGVERRFVNFAVDDLFVPDSQAELGVELAMAFIPGGKIGKVIGKGVFKGTDALRKHNKVVRDIVKEFGLDRKTQRMLHDEITKQGLGYHEIRELARDLAKKK